MFRFYLLALVASSGLGHAQQSLDPSKLHPIAVPIRIAGVFNWNTKQWVSGPKVDRQLASAQTVYRNTCTWTGGGFYLGIEHCEDLVDNGRLPSATTPLSSLPGMDANGVHLQSGVALSGATDDQIINNDQFAYCTGHATGGVRSAGQPGDARPHQSEEREQAPEKQADRRVHAPHDLERGTWGNSLQPHLISSPRQSPGALHRSRWPHS